MQGIHFFEGKCVGGGLVWVVRFFACNWGWGFGTLLVAAAYEGTNLTRGIASWCMCSTLPLPHTEHTHMQ